MVLNKDYQPIKATIERAIGDTKFSPKLGDDREEIMTYYETIHAANKKFDGGHQYWVFKEFIGYRQVQNKEKNNHPEW